MLLAIVIVVAIPSLAVAAMVHLIADAWHGWRAGGYAGARDRAAATNPSLMSPPCDRRRRERILDALNQIGDTADAAWPNHPGGRS